MKKLVAAFFLSVICLHTLSANDLQQESQKTMSTPKDPLQRLIEGNKRFQNEKMELCLNYAERRSWTALEQNPFCILVICSDSRTPPEIIFDQGFGDLFVVRVAGNVIGPVELESITFAVTNFDVSLIFVIGHESCGAVRAVVSKKDGSIPVIANLIEPAAREAKNLCQASTNECDVFTEAAKANAKNMIKLLKDSKEVGPLIEKSNIQLAAGYYTLKNGSIEVLKD